MPSADDKLTGAGVTPGQAAPAPEAWRARPSPVDAWRLTPENGYALWQLLDSKPHHGLDGNTDGLAVYTRDGRSFAAFGDWIVRAADGELDVYGDEMFRELHEPARGVIASQQPAPTSLPKALSHPDDLFEAWWDESFEPDDGPQAPDRHVPRDAFRAGWDKAHELIKAAIEREQPQPAPGLCPGGCGCRLGTDDADRRECGCEGGCCDAQDWFEVGDADAGTLSEAATAAGGEGDDG